MSPVTEPGRWREIERLFHAASELDAPERAAYLDVECNGDSTLRAEVESLLKASDDATDFLAAPISGAVKAIASEVGMQLAPGTHIEHYQVISLLGKGGMGEVYLAFDTRLRRQVALKILTRELEENERAFKRFENEAQAASALNHPNILTIYEFGKCNGMYFIASEYIEGPTLREKMEDGNLSVQTTITIGCQIASALVAAHASGIIHRDIKPENIIERKDGLVKLLDFGIAKLSEEGATGRFESERMARRFGDTQLGLVIGTVKYMSPEQAQGIAIDARSDLFTVGSVMYEMLTGTPAFAGESKGELIAEIVGLDPPPISEALPTAPPELIHIVCKALRKDREARYQTARDLLMDLQDLTKKLEFEANLQRAGYSEGQRRPRPTTGGLRGGSTPLPAWRAQMTKTEAPAKPGRWPVVWICVAVLAGFLGAGLLARYFAGRRAASAQAGEARSLAVLPFENLNPDPQTDFLQFSLADAVITKLEYVSALTVRPSWAIDAYRNRKIDPMKVARELHVNLLLTGTYLKDGDDLRITLQLADVKANAILWRDAIEVKYDKLLTIQDRVAEEVIDGLALRLSPAEAKRFNADKPANTKAYEYYLRGVDLYSLNEFGHAVDMLEKSTDLEPDYAPAWANLGRAYTTNASLQFGGRKQYAEARAAYERAIALDPGLVEAQVYLANLLTDTGNVEQAVPLLREALRTDPKNAEAHWELGYAYRFAGMLQESVAEGEQARRLDPEVKINSSALNSYLYLGEYDKFLESLPATNAVYTLFYRGLAEFYLNHTAQAESYFDRAYQLDPVLLPSPIGKAMSETLKHHAGAAADLLRQTESRIDEQGVRDPEVIYKLAQAYAVSGDQVAGLRVLRQSIEGGFFCYPYFEKDRLLNNLRTAPEFQPLMAEARKRHEQFKARFSR